MRMQPERIKAMYDQLQKTSAEYISAKEQLERSRVDFEAAKEKFAGVRRLASGMLTSLDWYKWKERNPQVQYACMSIGEATLQTLRDRAYDSAFNYMTKEGSEFSPEMTMERILETLESGGFDFYTATPLRELNAALINLKGITKTDSGFRAEDADDIFEKSTGPPDDEP
jgi:hypothetical protein